MSRNWKSVFIATPLLVLLAACSGSSEESNRRLVELGNKYHNQGKFKEASIIYRRILAKDPRFGEAHYRLGITSMKMGRPADALRYFRRASELQANNDDAHAKLGELYLLIYLADPKKNKQFLVDFTELSDRLLKKNPRHFEGLRMKGYVAMANQNFAEAVNSFSQANEVKPKNGPVVLALANAHLSNKQPELAEKVAREGIASDKSFGGLYDFLYLVRLREKKIDEAERILLEKTASNPKSPAFLLELASHYFRVRKRDQMRETLLKLTSNTKDFPDAHRMAGDFFVRIGDYESAYKEFDEGAKTQPELKVSFQKKQVELLSLQGRRGDAVSLSQKLVEANPEDPEAKALRAALRLQSGDRKELDSAIAELTNVLKQMPDNPVIRFNLGEAHLNKGDLEPARVQFLEAIKLRPNYVQPKMALGRIHLARGEWAKSQQMADEALQISKGLIPARLMRITALMGLQELKTARTEVDELLKLRPDHRDALYLRTMMDFGEKKWPDSEKGFSSLYSATPPDQRGLFGLVEVYMQTGRAALAKQVLDRELKNNPPNPRNIKLALANVALRTRNYDEGVALYKDLVQESPNSAELWLRLGETYKRWNKLDDAIQSFEKAKQLAPNNVTPWLQLAMTKEAFGKKHETRPLYEQILKLSPDNFIALNNLAYMLAEAGQDLDQALTYAQKAKQQHPGNDDIADTLGWVYIKKNLSDDAIKIFRDLLQKKPGHVTWRYHLAMALFQKGDKLQARKELETALKNGPKPDEAEKINTLLSRIS